MAVLRAAQRRDCLSPVEHVVENPCFMVKLDPGTRAERRPDGIWHSPDGLLR